MAKLRLDAELVRRGLASSRAEARRAIEEGIVLVKGMPTARVATMVSPSDPIALTGEGRRFVSRGGDKLDGALDRLDVVVKDRRWLDAGASTGGFTDRLLRGGATAVIAADVGYGQLDWGLRNDERVTVLERTNVRTLTPGDLPWRPDGVVADLSFISLTLVLPALADVVATEGDFVLMVKPQFEVGKDRVGRGGVVKDPALWTEAVERVVASGAERGLVLAGATASDVIGPAGNREFFVHLSRRGPHNRGAIERAIAEAPPT
ncbi:MAG: TlyA family RNA methyltransferase [Actinomycetota bacterium]